MKALTKSWKASSLRRRVSFVIITGALLSFLSLALRFGEVIIWQLRGDDVIVVWSLSGVKSGTGYIECPEPEAFYDLRNFGIVQIVVLHNSNKRVILPRSKQNPRQILGFACANSPTIPREPKFK